MKRKKKTSLPRVTLMAYNRRDLVAFVQAVEVLRLLVEDLRAVARDLKDATAAVPKTAKRGKKPQPVSVSESLSSAAGGAEGGPVL